MDKTRCSTTSEQDAQPSVDINTYPWLHIYAQFAWHDEAVIEGTRAALTNLRNAINRALHGEPDTDAEAIVADGEEYIVEVKIRTHEYLRGQRLPYTASFIQNPRRRKQTVPQTVLGTPSDTQNTDESINTNSSSISPTEGE